ncbi:MAG TPA: AraD1 family protein [Dongiaceae bacterium]|nr:AraD1 family protein [Dongiaceae bacterium]
MRLVQFTAENGGRHVAIVEGDRLHLLDATDSVYRLALDAIAAGRKLAELATSRRGITTIDYDGVIRAGRLLPPLDHPDPAHFFVCGTGLTHLGSAVARDKMNAKLKADAATLTDSMKMFRLGLEGGKPKAGAIGVQPEWFYKGDGSCVVPPEATLPSPAFALDGGEEGEVVGLYVNGPDGGPWRIGFALGNEFSDHVTERQNYLYLAHSKLRACSFGPELLVGELPADLRGTVRVMRGGKPVWQEDFLSGEANMTHSIANLEHHHFKYALFRRPGDAHAHFFGAATLSFAAGITCEPGDLFEIEVPAFGRPLRNALAAEKPRAVQVGML